MTHDTPAQASVEARRKIAMICMEIEDGRDPQNVEEMFSVYEHRIRSCLAPPDDGGRDG